MISQHCRTLIRRITLLPFPLVPALARQMTLNSAKLLPLRSGENGTPECISYDGNSEVAMRGNSSVKLLALCVASLVVTVTGARPVGAMYSNNQQGAARAIQEVSVNLTRLPENPSQYSLVLADSDEHVISGSFSVDQLQILRAIMAEAEKFAMTSEAAGAKESTTTRFSDKQERAFLVDVQKSGNLSILFFTITTETGRMTWTAGRVVRSTRRNEGFFFDLLSRLEEALPKLPGQSK